ncbi:hypothetical protein BJY52DRAFT_1193762 [Lactarius psammicola]|nr:hypothetical protein BJY52DRAFT_1193762 [Lactarius psammicola]
MADDLPALAPALEVGTVPPVLPALQPIPLLPGLAEMLNALQLNLMTSFTAQINHLSSRIDVQDEIIKTGLKRERRARLLSLPRTQSRLDQNLPSQHPLPPARPPQTSTPEVLPVPDPLPVLRPPPPPRHPVHPVLSYRIKRRRTPGGLVCKGRGANPTSTDNTEITIARGKGLADKSAEAGLYKSNLGNIVQVARSAMERMSAQAPTVLYGRWSVNANSHNFVYVFAGIVPFYTILQYTKALVEPLGVGNPLPNKGWTFAQLCGVLTSDGAGVIHSSETLLQEI